MSAAQIAMAGVSCQGVGVGVAKTYHHGGLRAALLTAARVELEQHGYEALSLRALARDIGVASSAPYAHFDSREALFWALIDEGGDELGAMFSAIAHHDATAAERLAMAARAYLGFAKAQPELMRLLFVATLSTRRESPAAARSIAVFEALVGDVMASVDVPHVRDVAIGCWSVLHGFAMLRLHDRLAPDIQVDRAAEAIIDATVRLARSA